MYKYMGKLITQPCIQKRDYISLLLGMTASGGFYDGGLGSISGARSRLAM